MGLDHPYRKRNEGVAQTITPARRHVDADGYPGNGNSTLVSSCVETVFGF